MSGRLGDQTHPNLNGDYIDKVIDNRKATIGVRF